jgi:hypothetical protein
MDLSIAVGIWICGIGMALVGIEMTITPPCAERPNLKWLYRIAFGTLGLAFIILSIWQTNRNTQSQQRQQDQHTQEQIRNEGNLKYVQGQLDTTNQLLARLTANSDPKQVAALLTGMNVQKSTLKKDTLTFCSEMEQWSKDRLKSDPPPTIAIPSKATQAENDAQNAYWQRWQGDYYTRFGSRALALLQQYGAKGVDVRALEQGASYGFVPQNIVLELRAFANRLDENGNLKN